MTEASLIITSQLDRLADLTTFTDAYCDREDLSDPVRFKLHMILEELATNTILYGYKEDANGWLRFSFIRDPGTLRISLEDGAAPFDITTMETAPDTSDDLETREVGGLGLFLVKEMADHLHYERGDGTNRVNVELFT